MVVNIIYQAVCWMVEIINFLIIIRVILSWLPLGNNPITAIVYGLTEPILGPIRNMLRKSPLGGSGMMLDFSPIIAFIFLNILLRVIGSLLGGF